MVSATRNSEDLAVMVNQQSPSGEDWW